MNVFSCGKCNFFNNIKIHKELDLNKKIFHIKLHVIGSESYFATISHYWREIILILLLAKFYYRRLYLEQHRDLSSICMNRHIGKVTGKGGIKRC